MAAHYVGIWLCFVCISTGEFWQFAVRRECRRCWLRYLCGLDYFEKGNRVFPSKEPCVDCMVVHNNWIVSREAKIYRFKEHFMWMYDKHSYYRYSYLIILAAQKLLLTF